MSSKRSQRPSSASLAYVTVILYGTPCAIIGALGTPWLTKKADLEVID